MRRIRVYYVIRMASSSSPKATAEQILDRGIDLVEKSTRDMRDTFRNDAHVRELSECLMASGALNMNHALSRSASTTTLTLSLA